jgi:hypothetical protein
VSSGDLVSAVEKGRSDGTRGPWEMINNLLDVLRSDQVNGPNLPDIVQRRALASEQSTRVTRVEVEGRQDFLKIGETIGRRRRVSLCSAPNAA